MSRRKKQIGTERMKKPLPVVHPKASIRKTTLNRVFILLTIVFWFVYLASTIHYQLQTSSGSFRSVVETVIYVLLMSLLNGSALMYLFSRGGAFKRFNQHSRVPRETLDNHFNDRQPPMTVLIPSYDEEVDVIRKTMLSAALQEYPNLRIVLLIDDKVNPSDPEAFQKLEETKALAAEVERTLKKPRNRFEHSFKQFKEAYPKEGYISMETLHSLAEEYRWASEWLTSFAKREPNDDHVDDFFIFQVLKDLSDELSLIAKSLHTAVRQNAPICSIRAGQLYRRLIWIFTAEVTFFQRKRFISLSQEPNKAMNLNSYIDLMGGKYAIDHTPEGEVLVEVDSDEQADIVIPDSEFLLTLDADSILLRDYCLRLVYLLQQPQNEKIAVTQTPYSSFRATPTRIERMAGATTDIQHLLHQGSTYFDATFWVGANAVIRKKALEDIAETEIVNGFEVRRFIQDRTVIEDTESSVDLEKKGWGLANYPERLSYSATPPDFGSLIIQRRRWANGGLLILPKLFSAMRQRKREGNPMRWMETLLRMNYMASIAWAGFGLILLLAYPFDESLLSIYLLFSAAPYFLAMASDLKYSRYRRSDIFSIYGFNMILLAVNVAGVLKSFQQALTDAKIPFARTPKVNDRTSSPTIYLLFPLIIIAWSVYIFTSSYNAGNWGNALFAGFNAVATMSAVVSFIGIRNMFVDFWNNFKNWLYVDVTEEVSQTNIVGSTEIDWRSVLYYGNEKETLPIGQSIQGYNVSLADMEATGNQSDETVETTDDSNSTSSNVTTTQTLTKRKISKWKALILGGMVFALFGMFSHREQIVARVQPSEHETWFASYVDATATPKYHFEQFDDNVVLSFVVASDEGELTPTWGGYYTLDEADQNLDLGRRIVRLRQRGRDVIVSFGGLLNDELALRTNDVQELYQMYYEVVERYELNTIDLDLENEGLTNREAGRIRANAVARLQSERAYEGHDLAVWVTLPVLPSGLTEDGVDAVAELLDAGVELAGVNVMVMNFGESKNPDLTFAENIIKSLNHTHRQLRDIYYDRSIYLSNAILWSKIGATPMIGQNDVKDEIFRLEDAQVLNEFAKEHQLGRVSMWSANRDFPNSIAYSNTRIVSDNHSGVQQNNQEFAKTLQEELNGVIFEQASNSMVSDLNTQDMEEPDEQENSPYPIWSQDAVYMEGSKVVWRHYVYEARWWTRGDSPDLSHFENKETPWRLLGPVLPNEKPHKQYQLPEGFYPEWEADKVYEEGDRISFENYTFEARWWNNNHHPESSIVNPENSPWEVLTQNQIKEILEAEE